jgi:hypothetical protein
MQDSLQRATIGHDIRDLASAGPIAPAQCDAGFRRTSHAAASPFPHLSPGWRFSLNSRD